MPAFCYPEERQQRRVVVVIQAGENGGREEAKMMLPTVTVPWLLIRSSSDSAACAWVKARARVASSSFFMGIDPKGMNEAAHCRRGRRTRQVLFGMG